MKWYLLIFNNTTGTREYLQHIFNEYAWIDDWRSEIPNTFYIKTSESASKIVAALYNRTGPGSLFFVTEISKNSDGALSLETWKLLKSIETEHWKEGSVRPTSNKPRVELPQQEIEIGL